MTGRYRRESDTKIELLLAKIETVEEKIDDHVSRTEIMSKRLERLEQDFLKYKSFFGGIVFVLSAIWAFITLAFTSAWDNLAKAFGGH